MENATKALLIAAAIMILTIILSLLVISYGRVSDYFEKEHDNTVVEQLERFNSQFDNYAKTTIRGNEMLSMINKVVDYNTKQSEYEGYDEIELNIKGIDEDILNNSFKNHPSDDNLFTSNDIENQIKNKGTKEISFLVSDLLEVLKGEISHIQESHLQTLVANISKIVLQDEYTATDDEIETRKKTIKNILKIDLDTIDDPEDLIKDIQEVTKKYYQLVQFKRAHFECTEVKHSRKTGRVIEMTFELVVDENGYAVFD